MRIILASASPQRVELLRLAWLDFETIPADIDEAEYTAQTPSETAQVLARAKANAVFDMLKSKDDTDNTHNIAVIGADTVVDIAGQTLGKPCDSADAARMLRLLSGRVHEVHTGVCIVTSRCEDAFVCTSEVEFYELTDAEIERYIASGEVFGKAGAYAIQGAGGLLVREIRGNFHNIVGLPVGEIARMFPLLRKC